MTEQHPLTPPSTLLELCFKQHYIYKKGFNEILIEVWRHGADQELEECCKWVSNTFLHGTRESNQLRDVRRPKPPSLKEQALSKLKAVFCFQRRYDRRHHL